MNNLNNTEYNRLDGITKKYVDWKTGPLPSPDDGFFFIDSIDDLPTPIGGVHYLEANTTYYFLGSIDLNGGRIIGSANTCLLGPSSENAFLTSTGLSAGTPFLYSEWTTPIQNLTFQDVDTAFYIDGNINPPVALDWTGVNFTNVNNVGVVNTCDNFVFTKGAFLGAQNFMITGTHGTVAFNNSIFRGLGTTGSIFIIDEDAVIERRFRVVYSSVIATSNTIGVSFSASASVPTESFILDTCNFSGGGVYLTGLSVSSNKTLFVNNTGISNTSVNGQIYMRDNLVTTVISNTTDYFKISGTTSISTDNEKYQMPQNNRLTNDATIERKYLIQCNLSFNSGNNNVCEFGFYDSKLGVVREPSKTKSTANASGRAENVSLSCVVKHRQGDFIEVWARNSSISTNITVTDMNIIITQII